MTYPQLFGKKTTENDKYDNLTIWIRGIVGTLKVRYGVVMMFFKKPWRWTIVNPDLEVHFLHLVSSPGIVSPSANQWNNGELTADHYPVIKRDAKSYDYPYSLWTRGSSQAHDNWSPIYQQLYLLFSVLPLVLNPSDRVLQHELEALIATILQLLFVNKMFFWP